MVSASHYRDLLQEERAAIAGLCLEWQRVLDDSGSDKGSSIPDDVCGKIQIAVGQAQLLMQKKFVQFNGLIEACEEESAEKPVTVDDLQGFWELVHIQVDDIHSKFSEVDELRKNNWEPLPFQETQRKPLSNLNKSAPNVVRRQKAVSVVVKEYSMSMEAKERLAQAKAMIRKRMKEQCCQ